jgi:outer membrane protein OmpA-like peptidoglycan-associated protein
MTRPRHALALAALLAASACASAPVPTAALDRSRVAVRAAEADPAVDRYARPELESAQDAFAAADRSVRRGLDTQVVQHWAYLAEQRAAIARETARLRSAEAQVRAARTARVEAEPVTPTPAAQAPEASGSSGTAAMTGGAALILNDDQFAGDGFALKPEAEAGIDRVARLLQEDPTRVARIDGHSADMDSRSRSIEFSGRRAEAVRGELVRRGIDARRIAVRALGDSFPIASNDTEIGRQRNRRVDIFVLPQGQPGQQAR